MPASRCILRTTRALLTEKRKRPSSSTRRRLWGSGIWEHWLTALNWRDFEAGIWRYTYTDGTKARAPTNNRRGRRPQLDASTNWTIPQGYKRREPRSRSEATRTNVRGAKGDSSRNTSFLYRKRKHPLPRPRPGNQKPTLLESSEEWNHLLTLELHANTRRCDVKHITSARDWDCCGNSLMVVNVFNDLPIKTGL